MTAPHLFCFGLGYTAVALARRLAAEGWTVSGTCRTTHKAATLRQTACHAFVFDRDHPLEPGALDGVTHLLASIPPDAAGDPVLAIHRDDIAQAGGTSWFGYLSTTAVYGDRGGSWVDETAELRPTGERGRRRVAAEQAWRDLWQRHSQPVHIFRLAGIYGPGRSAFDVLRSGRAKRIDRPGQVFSRIHVKDLADILIASINRPRPGAVYNVCDDEPSPPGDVVAYAAALIGMPLPPLVSLEGSGLSPMARSFYGDNKRVSNRLIKKELGVRLCYPDYRIGLAAILSDEACR